MQRGGSVDRDGQNPEAERLHHCPRQAPGGGVPQKLLEIATLGGRGYS